MVLLGLVRKKVDTLSSPALAKVFYGKVMKKVFLSGKVMRKVDTLSFPA